MEKVHNRRPTAMHKDKTFRKSSTTGQVQDNSNQIPRTCNKQTCYDSQLQGYFIWHCHLSHDPLAATSLDHRCTLVQVTYNTFKSSATSYKNIPKTEQWKTVNKLNCKTMTTVKTVVYIVQWVHMCPTACKWHQTTYKWNSWHQIQNSAMNITWTDITRHKESKTVATVKNLQNQCTASAR